MPEVCVVIPSYNAALYLAQAVDSVLAQTFTDLEILVIDDGSTDDTPSLVKRYGSRIRYVRQENAGVSLARNHGIELSLGKYVAFLDADDSWLPSKLAVQVALLNRHPEAGVCYSALTVGDADLKPLNIRRSPRQASVLEDLLLRGNVVGTPSSVMVRRQALERTGGFDSQLSQCADWDLWVRLAAETEFLYVDEPLVTYRHHAANMSRNAFLLEKDSWRVLEKGFALAGLPAALRARRRAAFAHNYMVLAGTYFHAGQRGAFVRCAARALALDPRQLQYLLQFPLRRWSRGRTRSAPAVA